MFPTILKELREKRNISQNELAKQLSVSSRLISHWETGGRMPSPDILIKISDYFNISVDYLLGRTEIKEPIQNIAKKDFSNSSINTESINTKDLSPESQEDLKKYIELLKLKDMKNRNKDIEVANDLTSIE